MNRFALLSLYRSLTRHKLYAALNIGGLAVGIAVFLVLSLYVRFETSFEKWLPNNDKIYLVETVWNMKGSEYNGPTPETMGGLLDELKGDFPDIVGTRYSGGKNGGSVLRNGVATREDLAQADPTFFDVFDIPMVKGDGRQALASPTGLLLSESQARKYFGTTDPIGQAMTIAAAGDTPKQYRVTGIFRDLPAATERQFTMLVQLPKTGHPEQWTHWGSTSLSTYLRFDTPAAAQAFEQKMPAFVERHGVRDMGPKPSESIGLAMYPLAKVHLTNDIGDGQRQTVVTLGVVGVLTLLIALVNYVNLATARAGLRAREVAMRKVLGGSRSALVRQFLGEAVLTVVVAALGGLILAELGLPLVNAAGGPVADDSLSDRGAGAGRAGDRHGDRGRLLPCGDAGTLSGGGGARLVASAGRGACRNADARGAGRLSVRPRHRLHDRHRGAGGADALCARRRYRVPARRPAGDPVAVECADQSGPGQCHRRRHSRAADGQGGRPLQLRRGRQR